MRRRSMLDNKGFDAWAGDYDESIDRFSKGYPFAGYYDVLGYVQSLVRADGKKVLDVGVGTGLLTAELYRSGAEIYGADFSEKMIHLAQKKMPNAEFFCFDFKNGLPEALKRIKFDYIVSSYAIHHLGDSAKVKFIQELICQLRENGRIIIADVAFETREEMAACQKSSGRAWDDDEFYLVAEDIEPELNRLGMNTKYTQISFCAGVLEVW